MLILPFEIWEISPLYLVLFTLKLYTLYFRFCFLGFGTLHIGDFSFILGTFYFETLYFGL